MDGILCGNEALRNSWHAVARTIEVQPGPHAVTLLGTKLVLWRGADGSVTAAPDRCPHREAPLSAGEVEAGCLVCPYHGWSFAGGGRCVSVPSAHDGVPVPPKAHLPAVRTQERYGLVWVCLGEPITDIPTIAQDEDPSFRRINTPVDAWNTSVTRMTDNFLDITHFPWVHTGTFGRRQDTQVPKVELEELDKDWFGYCYEVVARNENLGSVTSGQTEGLVHRRMSSGFHLPFDVRSEIHYDTGLSHILLLLSTPVDDTHALFTFVVWRNDDFSVATDEIIQFDLAIGAEDKRMLQMLDGVLPLDQTSVVSVQADKCSVEWRRQLVQFMGL